MTERSLKIIFSPPAQRTMEGLEMSTALQLARDIKDYLETGPLPIGKTRIKKLSGFKPSLFRLRSGDFRVYYRFIANQVIILAITDKKDSEKILKRLR